LPKESGSFNKNSLILAAQNYKKKSVCKYNSKFVPFYAKFRGFILAIESCDDTAAAVLHNDKVLSNVVANQLIHTIWRCSRISFSCTPTK
jgi:hypothetical protein